MADRRREIILGRSSKIWQTIARNPVLAGWDSTAIGHAELYSFEFATTDRVWVFAYSRQPHENIELLKHLQAAGVAEVVYVTSSSTIISSMTRCYEYPHAKKLAEDQAAAMSNGKVLTFGLVVEHDQDLPSGVNAVTTFDEIASFMRSPTWPVDSGKRADLLRIVRRPFRGEGERILYELYGWLMLRLSRRPCLLRPFDLVLRSLGMRWYGYTYLSNHLWNVLMTS